MMGSALGHLATGRLFPSHMPVPLPPTTSQGRLSLQPRSVLRACTEPGTCAVTGPGMNGRVNAGNGNNVYSACSLQGSIKGTASGSITSQRTTITTTTARSISFVSVENPLLPLHVEGKLGAGRAAGRVEGRLSPDVHLTPFLIRGH